MRIAVIAAIALFAGRTVAAEVAKLRPAASPSASAAAEEEQPAPRGSPEDVALWRSMVEAQNSVTLSRAEALELLRHLGQETYQVRLAEAAKQRPGEVRNAEPLRTRLIASWNYDYDALTRQWPVDPRLGCRSRRLDLEVAMEIGTPSELVPARGDARACLEKMTAAVRTMRLANKELASVTAEVEAALATSRSVAGGAETGTKPPPGADLPKPPEK